MAAKAIDRLKNVSEFDRKQVEKAEELFGPEPDTMGFFKNLHWGRIREELVFPYPEVSAEEKLRCDELIEKLDHHMKNEHPSFQVDQQQEIPETAINKLFKMGVMGMIIPQEYGGGGFSVTSYNRALECIGRYCGSTAVMVSAHQSIGCGALVIFGTEAQKKRWLYPMGNTTLSAFCLSEPDVGCDAGGQRTTCRLSEDGTHFILNGEKKWATSGALSGMFTVMAKQTMTDAKSGKEKEAVTALICTPDMEGVDIFSRNRSKCGIRGTWQARIRFTDVKVPVENVLHEQGRGLVVALTCLNYGRCTLSAGMVGAAKAAFEQSVKWAKYRYQFDEPLGAFEQVQEKVAKMAAYIHALDSMLYMTTGIVGRKDEDLMLETAACKTFCSEYGFRVVDNALQIMGGEGYMTENVVERLWRDSRINIIVEGANEVMYSFLFGYGGKQLGESMLDIKANPLKSPIAALKIAAQLFLGVKPAVNRIGRLDSSLDEYRDMLERRTQELSHEVKLAFKDHGEKLLARQMIQRRLAMAAVWVYAMFCSVSKLDQSIRVGKPAKELKRERQIVRHVCALGNEEIDLAYLALHKNVDETMRETAPMIMDWIDELPNSDFSIPESSPTEAKGSGYKMNTTDIPQFGSGSMYVEPVGEEKEKAEA